jgi:vanillate O-demethylase ferredoxin subunit
LDSGFTVKLARTGRSVFVPEGSTILYTLLSQGIDVAYSCGGGICGWCEVDVLAGVPDHRDWVLNDDERRAGKSMMICCSQSKTPEIELDL